MGSSIGVVPIQENYGALGVENITFALGTYGDKMLDFVSCTRHFYTFAGSLRLSFGYSWPTFGKEFAKNLASSDMQCLEMLAGADSDTMTVGSFLEML